MSYSYSIMLKKDSNSQNQQNYETSELSFFYRIVSAAGGDLPGVVLQEDIVDDVSQHLRGEGVPLVDGPAGDEEGVVPPAGARSHVGTVPGTGKDASFCAGVPRET